MQDTRTKSDQELLGAYAANRDEGAFEALVARHGLMVHRACLAALGNPQDAEDAAQGTFLVLARKAPQLRRGGDLTAWLFGVAGNVCRHARRKRAARDRHERGAASEMAADAAGPTNATSAREDVQALYRELDGLSARLRQAVLLRHFFGHTEKDAAAIAGCTPNTLSKRASDGLARLRERLGMQGSSLATLPLAELLEAEGRAALPETLRRACVDAGKGVAREAAQNLAKGVLDAMARTQWISYAAALVVCVTLAAPFAALFGATPEKPPHAEPAPNEPAPKQPELAAQDAEWPALTDSNVAYEGAFTPDGRYFVYALVNKPGEPKSELRAMSVATGEVQSLGDLPLAPAKLPAKPMESDNYLTVTACTNALDTVFLNQSLIEVPKGQYMVWKPAQKALVPLNANLGDADILGACKDGSRILFQTNRSPLALQLFDAKAGMLEAAIQPKLDRNLGYKTDLAWIEQELFAFSRNAKGSASGEPATEIRRLWPKEALLGAIPAVKKTLLTGTGAVEPTICYASFRGAPGSADKPFVFYRGGELVSWDPARPQEAAVRLEAPTTEVVSGAMMPMRSEQGEPRACAAWLEVACDEKIDFNDYIPAEKALGTKRTVTLKIQTVSLTAGAKPEPALSFNLTPRFDVLRKAALATYQKQSGPKSDSGVLTRQPYLYMMGAKDGRLLLMLNLYVHYGIWGQGSYWPLTVDLDSKTLRHAKDYATRFASGKRFGPPTYFEAASPAGDVLAVIANQTLRLYRTESKAPGGR